MITVLKKILPWWLKIAAKLTLSRLPVQYKQWKKIHLFQHGSMISAQHAYSVFMKHFQLTPVEGDFVCLELGPGDTLFSCIIAKALGSSRTIFVDVGNFASHDMRLYKAMYDFLTKKGYDFKIDLTDFDNMMNSCHAVYLTSGLNSLKKISDHSIDLSFSQAVLEHIRAKEFLPTLKELRRILSPTGSSSHEIDLRDHLGGGLNNLRFSDLLWESDFFTRSGFYTNRIRYEEMMNLFEKTGFRVKLIDMSKWEKIPIARHKLNKKFRYLSEQDLIIAGVTVMLTH